MYLYITVAVVTILLASFVTGKEQLHTAGTAGAEGRQLMGGAKHPLSREQCFSMLCLAAVFLILFGLSALRQNVGNDYAKYVEFMHLINCDSYVPTEIGFNLLVKLIYGLSGYENYLLVFAVYAFVTVLVFLLAIYEQSDEFPLSFFLFMALGYYFQTFSTVRYYLALAIALYSMKFVLRKQWGRFLALVLLGSAFHKSLLVVIPLYFLASRRWKKWQLGLAALFCTTFLFLQDFYLKIVVFLYPTYEDTEYLEGGTSYINILRCAAVLIFAGVVLWMQRRQSGVNVVEDEDRQVSSDLEDDGFRFYFYLNLGALVLYVFCSFLPIISRIGYYLTVSQILFLPMLLQQIPDKKWRRLFRVGVILAAVLYLMMYLSRADNDGVLILPYQSFFFHDMVNILSDVN